MPETAVSQTECHSYDSTATKSTSSQIGCHSGIDKAVDSYTSACINRVSIVLDYLSLNIKQPSPSAPHQFDQSALTPTGYKQLAPCPCALTIVGDPPPPPIVPRRFPGMGLPHSYTRAVNFPYFVSFG